MFSHRSSLCLDRLSCSIPQPPLRRIGKRVAIVGSGSTGLAAVDQLAKAEIRLTVVQREDGNAKLALKDPNINFVEQLVARFHGFIIQESTWWSLMN